MFSFLKKKKPVIKLSDFLDIVMEEAKKEGKSYGAVTVDLTQYHTGERHIEIKGYIDGNTWITGKSIEEVVQGLREHHSPSKSKISDAEFSIETETV